MSIVLSAGEYYSRTTNLPARTAYSIGGWIKVGPTTAGFSNIFGLESGSVSAANGTYLGWDDSVNRLTVFYAGGASSVLRSSLSKSTWYYMALVGSGTDVLAYTRAEGESSFTSLTGISQDAFTSAFLAFMNDSYAEVTEGNLRYVRVWSAALSSADLLTESASTTLVRTANINADYPMSSLSDDNEDQSGNTFNMTTSGSPATDASEPTITIGGGGGTGQPTAKRHGGVPFMGTGGFKGNLGGSCWRALLDWPLIAQEG